MDRNKRIRKQRPGTPKQQERKEMHIIGSNYERELFYKEFPFIRNLTIPEREESSSLSPEESEKGGWKYDHFDPNDGETFARIVQKPVLITGFEVKLGGESILLRGHSMIWAIRGEWCQSLPSWKNPAHILEFEAGDIAYMVAASMWDKENDDGYSANIIIFKPPKDGGWTKAFQDAKESVRQEMNAAMMIE